MTYGRRGLSGPEWPEFRYAPISRNMESTTFGPVAVAVSVGFLVPVVHAEVYSDLLGHLAGFRPNLRPGQGDFGGIARVLVAVIVEGAFQHKC